MNPAGHYEGAVALVNDITALHESQMQGYLRATILDAVGEAVVATTPDGRIVYINSAAERLFGWRAIEVIGRSHQDVCAQVPEQAADIRSSVMTGKPSSGRLELFRRDGSRFFAHVTTEPALDEHGAVIGIVAAISDQSEHARLEHNARTRQLQAETLAVLGAQALRQRLDPRISATVITEVIEATRRLLGADHAAMLDLIPGAQEFQVRAACPPVEMSVAVPAGSRSFSGYIALAPKVVVVGNTLDDLRLASG